MPSQLEADYWTLIGLSGLPLPDKSNWDYRYADGEKHVRKLQVDFAWAAYRVAVEIQGGTHAYGVHVDPVGYKSDREKSNEAQLRGWILLEFTIEHIRSGYAVDATRRALSLRGWRECTSVV